MSKVPYNIPFDSKVQRLKKRYQGLSRVTAAINDLYIYGVYPSNYPNLTTVLEQAKDHVKAEIKETTGGHTASDGQVKYLRDLLGQLPEEEQQKYKDVVLSDSITWQYAKENIPVMQALVDEANLNKDKPPF